VTDATQALVSHEEYFPSGEVWIDQDNPAPGIPQPYLFNGKELDTETGLYYYGARYYDPRVQIWASPDPILSQYMRGSPAGGVLNPQNLGLYTYAWNSPLVHGDPDGLCPDGCDPEMKDPKVRETAGRVFMTGVQVTTAAYGGFLLGRAAWAVYTSEGVFVAFVRTATAVAHGYIVGKVVHETADAVDPTGITSTAADALLVVSSGVRTPDDALNSRLTPDLSVGEPPTGKVPYGSTDLSQAVQARRISDGGTLGRTGNYAAARLEDGTILTGRSSATMHAEEDLLQQSGGRKIVDVYSEREPCEGNCGPLLNGIRTTWSWDWNGSNVDRAATTKAILQTVRGIFK
jgi:RHS repeat-associated protein